MRVTEIRIWSDAVHFLRKSPVILHSVVNTLAIEVRCLNTDAISHVSRTRDWL